MAKDAYYFSHDSNARHDPKILEMRSVYGLEGYGRYWVLIEVLREQSDYKLKKSKHLFNALAMQMQCDADAVHCYVSDCINEFELLQENDEFIWCDSLNKRMKNYDEKSENARKAAKARWNKPSNDNVKSDSNADVMQPHSERNASKVKESKVKESKVNKLLFKEYVRLTNEEHIKLIEQLGQALTDDLIDRLNNYIGSSGKKYKSHYHTILTWSRKEKPKEVKHEKRDEQPNEQPGGIQLFK